MKVPASLYWRTRAMVLLKPLYKSLGDFESWLLKSDLRSQKITKPVYVTSLARSGTTIVTEILSQHESVCSHTYGDFPGIYTPYWNNWIRQKQSFLAGNKIERSHNDRILINNNSPDAFEEVLWMYFYPEIHKDKTCETPIFADNNKFSPYYIQHIKKHLLVKNKSRYLAKANYNIGRIEYILSLFPDARFIVPIRHPVNHIASLIKQHKIYTSASEKNPKIDKQLAASGHFEFGKNRQVINLDKKYTDQVLNSWSKGHEIQGWAQYWKGLYQSVINLKSKSSLLNNAIKFIKYEDLCQSSSDTIDQVFQFCQFEDRNCEELKTQYEDKLSLPKYYQIAFKNEDVEKILDITHTVSNEFGYNIANFN